MNPAAYSGRAGKQYKKIISEFKKRDIAFESKWTQAPSDAINLAKEAKKQNCTTVVAVGGDGTICEVISGLFDTNEIGAKPKLGVLHVGTSPDFNRYHKIPTNIEDAIQILLQGKTKLIDIGKITYYPDPNREKETVSYFASNVNVGLGPQIAKRANSRYRKYLGDFLGTLSATLTSVLGFRPMDLYVKIDGKEMQFKQLINLTIGKDPYLASGMRVPSQIKPDDTRMYVLSIKKTSWINLFSSIPKLYLGNFLDYKGADISYAEKIEIDYNQKYPWIEFDGDIKGYLPAKIEIMHKALEIIVP